MQFFSNLFKKISERSAQISIISLGSAVILLVIGAFAFTRSYMLNGFFSWVLGCGLILATCLIIGSLFFQDAYSTRFQVVREVRIVGGNLVALASLAFSFSLVMSLFVYVPSTDFEAIVVPDNSPSAAYAIAPLAPHIGLPWQEHIYTRVDAWKWGTRFKVTQDRTIFVSIDYQGDLVDLWKVWGSPDNFYNHWEEQCHAVLDPILTDVGRTQGESAFTSLESRCAAFTPAEQALLALQKGKRVVFRLSV
ncbi:MAG: hypothetical protein AAB515_03565 [Patescibacteria group bacterium]